MPSVWEAMEPLGGENRRPELSEPSVRLRGRWFEVSETLTAWKEPIIGSYSLDRRMSAPEFEVGAWILGDV